MLLEERIIFIIPTSILDIIIFVQRKSNYKEFFIDPTSISVKKLLFSWISSKQHTLRNNLLHPVQW